MAESGYIHGTAPDEQRRLSGLNELLNQAALKELSLSPGERVLDVGSGLGQLARAMARAVGPSGQVVGVERSVEQRTEAFRLMHAAGEQGRVEFRAGDAQALPLKDPEWATFDVAHARFLLEHVPDPLAVVTSMVRAVRPGGRVVLQDDDHDVLRLYPEPPGFRAAWGAYLRTYDRLGNDAYVGRRLVSLLHRAGAQPVRNTWLFFGGCAGNPSLPALVTNMVKILAGAREAMLRWDLLDAQALDEAMANLRAWGERPDAAVWYAVAWAEGRRV